MSVLPGIPLSASLSFLSDSSSQPLPDISGFLQVFLIPSQEQSNNSSLGSYEHHHPLLWSLNTYQVTLRRLNFLLLTAAKSLQSRPTLCNPIDGSPPGSPSLGFSRQDHWSGLPFPSPMHESEKWKVKVKLLSRVHLLVTPWTAAYQAPPSMGFSRQEYWSGWPCLNDWVLELISKMSRTLSTWFH